MVDLYALLRPLLFTLDAEMAHRVTVRALAAGLVPDLRRPDDIALASKVWGRNFANPIGLAAGFDKNAEALAGIYKLGFGFAEAGSVTPKPQVGNPRPRVFRLPEQRAVINRYGMNNQGLDAFLARVRKWREDSEKKGGGKDLLGINVSPNKDAADGPRDYVTCVQSLAPYADYLVMNVSSPNTPGLRGLQNRAELAQLLATVQDALTTQTLRPPLLVKIAPDLTPEMCADIAEVAVAAQIDGMILTNTTVARPPYLPARYRDEAGGLSGAPLLESATETLRAMYALTGGTIPLVGVGGVASGADAYEKIRAGASLVQLYTGLVYAGPMLIQRIKDDLAALLRRDGFAHVHDAVGIDHRAAAAGGAAPLRGAL
jgi:dihydroorotate dehydrogenase